MKIRLIQPIQLDEQDQPTKYQKLFMPFNTLATLAGLTPPGVDVGITDDYVDDVDFEEKADLVGITSQTCQAPRAYHIADEFRKRGRKVVMGGFHATMCPEEALQHCDAVCVGEAENIWERIIKDASDNNLKRIYKDAGKPDLSRLVIPRFDLFNFDNYVIPPFAKTPLITIQSSRGCPFRCDFCSVTRFFGEGIRAKPVENVMREIESVKPSRLFFTDDNIIADPDHARRLFDAVKHLKIRWCCQMSTTVLKRPDLIELAAEAGCHESLIGIESLNQESLRSVHKGFNQIDQYAELFRIQKQVGILSQASIVFGLDYDTLDSLRRAVETILEWDINYLYVHILTPLPGTKLYEDMARDGRIRDPNWSKYDCTHLVIEPKSIRMQELEDAVWMAYERFYSAKQILRRTWGFRREYTRFFPRDMAVEELFFQFHIRNSIKQHCHPFSLGLRKNGK